MFSWPMTRPVARDNRALRSATHDEMVFAVARAIELLLPRPGGATDRQFGLEALSQLHAAGASAPLGLLVAFVHDRLAQRRPPRVVIRQPKFRFDGKC
jgi:hypothetical protein